ncbi:M16 family metallopeptidase [Pajaroellobacter abortibovis]|uniref:Peptidase M16 n=1 Tax=Pajaroellobacter abortibovis TaxID=1882918 RepID=A0A1L6MWX6_9BACT|nr:pitrilysin family protein [Pajaroellobacter abortibovis]APS00061.1 hypothetical protein BCY86_04725 [Pajaroellobacter abortibovis]
MRFSWLLSFLLFAVIISEALAESPSSSAISVSPVSSTPSFTFPIREETLRNGLRVVLLPDANSPTVGVAVTYDVGSRNERRGLSGFAHLFEHMMFQGSQHVPRGGHFQLITQRGGILNGTTNEERTNYFQVMPRDELPLMLWLEADRMRALNASLENFENQRAVVKEEYRMRVENSPYIKGIMRGIELAFGDCWPYAHPTIGSMQDLDNAPFEEVQKFHRTYYNPSHAVLSISGGFDEKDVLELIHRYFDPISAHPSPPESPSLPLLSQKEPRGEIIADLHATLPGIWWGWSIPTGRTPDYAALNMAARLLADGESSRLYRRLVREKGIAVEVDAWVEPHRGASLFALWSKISEKGTLEEVEEIFQEEMISLARFLPADVEMNKLRLRARSSILLPLQLDLKRAVRVGDLKTLWNDPNPMKELEQLEAVTPSDIQKAVVNYLTLRRRTRVEIQPGPKPSEDSESLQTI